MIEFGCFKDVNLSFDLLVKKLPTELRRKGFDVLSVVRMDREFREHLSINFKKYAIMNISNLQLAFRALSNNEINGLLQTYNIVIYPQNDISVIGVLRPTQLIQSLGNEYLNEGAAIIERKLLKTLDGLNKKRFLKEKSSPEKAAAINA